jgi:hypothetical protein
MTFQTDSQITQIATGATGTSATADGQNTAATRKRAFTAGTRIVSLKCAAGESTSYNFPDNGVLCTTNISANVSGTAAIAYLYWN